MKGLVDLVYLGSFNIKLSCVDVVVEPNQPINWLQGKNGIGIGLSTLTLPSEPTLTRIGQRYSYKEGLRDR